MLSPAVDAARRTLRRLDDEEIPAPLARIAMQSARRLPPPMARRVIEELNENDWFREQVAGDWDTADPGSPITTLAASALFVLRPDGWEDRLAALRAEEETEVAAREQSSLERRVGELEEELAVARRKARRAQREAELASAEAERRVTAARSAARSSRGEEAEEIEMLRRENATLHAQVESVTAELRETRDRLASVRRELLRERRAERPPERPPARSLWSDLDALHRARLLDEVVVAFGPGAVVEEPPLPFDTQPLRLPTGVAPDGKEALEWLLWLDRPLTVLVDGYNVTFLLDPNDFSSSRLRNRLNDELARFRRTSPARHRIVVVYDSDQAGGITSETGPGGIEVRFTTAGHPADDEILTLATELGNTAVVISTDRRVREGSERVGALGLWGQALSSWISG
jgi:hypothetical protein